MSRIFNVDGKQMIFSFLAFRTFFDTYQRGNHLKVKDLIEQLSADLDVSCDTIINWRKGKNGPSDVELIKSLATSLKIKDYTALLKEKNGDNKMEQLTDRQKTAAKKIYDKCIWFLDEFIRTDGFIKYIFEFQEMGLKDPKGAANDKVSKMMDEVGLVYDQEYFDLKWHPIFDEYGEFLSEELYEAFNGKIDVDYRHKAEIDGHPTAWDDYDRAMIALNGIIDKYL